MSNVQVRFVDVPGVGDLLATYWTEVTARLAHEFNDAAAQKPFVRTTLVREYPRARAMLRAVLHRLQATTHAVAVKVR